MKDLIEIIEKGIISDLYKSEQSLLVYNLIARKSKNINSKEDFIKKTFSYIQQISKNESIISLARVLDKHSDRNKTRCLESALNFVTKNHESLIPSRAQNVFEQLNKCGIPENLLKLLEQENSHCFNLKLAIYYQEKIDSLSSKIKKVKIWRDKILAHNEAISKEISVKIIELQDIYNLGWEFVKIIGWLYLNNIYGFNGDHTIKNQSRFRSFDIEKLMNELKIGA
ncbi:MAG: hypothetical protein K9G76_11255 [Bacteroidales bacterium]|nr:hypothetical protein [Bacteroidales bacterium]MCF8404971.1 hypothetical protein [Bacteroidales bacterium]